MTKAKSKSKSKKSNKKKSTKTKSTKTKKNPELLVVDSKPKKSTSDKKTKKSSSKSKNTRKSGGKDKVEEKLEEIHEILLPDMVDEIEENIVKEEIEITEPIMDDLLLVETTDESNIQIDPTDINPMNYSNEELEENVMEFILEACRNDQMDSINYTADLAEQLCLNDPLFKNNDGRGKEISRMKQLQDEEVINCTCGYREEDGLMIQCDVCLAWQHALCCGMNSYSDVPENYLCVFCMNPWNVRPTQRYSYAKHFLTLSKMPKFSHRTFHEDLIKYRQEVMRKTYELTADLRNINRMERTLTAKLSIAEEPDHPKLYMWSANWDSSYRDDNRSINIESESTDLSIDGPIGEQPIESFDCRLRLLDKIEADQRDVSYRLALIYEQLRCLESHDYDRKNEEMHLKTIMRMFARDLNTIATAVSIS